MGQWWVDHIWPGLLGCVYPCPDTLFKSKPRQDPADEHGVEVGNATGVLCSY